MSGGAIVHQPVRKAAKERCRRSPDLYASDYPANTVWACSKCAQLFRVDRACGIATWERTSRARLWVLRNPHVVWSVASALLSISMIAVVIMIGATR